MPVGEKSADECDVDHEVAVLGLSIYHSLLAEREEAEELRWTRERRRKPALDLLREDREVGERRRRAGADVDEGQLDRGGRRLRGVYDELADRGGDVARLVRVEAQLRPFD